MRAMFLTLTVIHLLVFLEVCDSSTLEQSCTSFLIRHSGTRYRMVSSLSIFRNESSAEKAVEAEAFRGTPLSFLIRKGSPTFKEIHIIHVFLVVSFHLFCYTER